jgi:hypothetical protein
LQQADLAVAPIFPTTNRLKVVAFTQHFLDVEATILLRKPPPGAPPTIRRAADLLEQSEIQYGLWDTGILIRAFRRSNHTLYKILWRNIQRFTPNAFTESTRQGIERVRHDKYAFIIPHPIGEYVAQQYPCDLMTVDRFLLKKGYALAVAKGSPLLSKLNQQALNALRRSHYLQQLYQKWWYDNNECGGIQSSKMYSSNSNSNSAPSTHGTVSCMGIKNMSSLLIKDICDVIGKQEYMAVRDVSVLRSLRARVTLREDTSPLTPQ